MSDRDEPGPTAGRTYERLHQRRFVIVLVVFVLAVGVAVALLF